MKDQLKRFVVRHPLLEKCMFHFYRIKGKQAAKKESERRKSMSIFDFQALSEAIPYSPEERVIDNNLYGYAHHIKKFAGITNDLNGYVEHGLFWGGMVHQDERNWHFERIITMSSRRKRDIEKKLPQKTGIPLGPYIHYAESIFADEQHKALKKELGRVLLVFPSHSVKNVDAKYDLQQFVKAIEERKKDYDTVLISLYFIDAQNADLVKTYTGQGYRIVTSGYKFDNNFVARQRALIQLADMTMSNEVGTHIGYCLYLNKPHYVYRQQIKLVAISEFEQKRIETVSEPENYRMEREQKEEFKEIFGSFAEEISAEQRLKCADFWGFDDIKTAEELRSIFN